MVLHMVESPKGKNQPSKKTKSGTASNEVSKSSSSSKKATIVEEHNDTDYSHSEERLLAVAVTLLCIGTTGFYYLPGMLKEDAEGSRLVNAFYCTVMTLTT